MPKTVTGTRPVFMQPKSLYVELTAAMSDGTEQVIRLRLEPGDPTSELVFDMENLVENDLGEFRPAHSMVRQTGLHDLTISFTRCRLTDPN